MSYEFRLESVTRWRELQFKQSLAQLAIVISEESRQRDRVLRHERALRALGDESRLAPGSSSDAALLRDREQRSAAIAGMLSDARHDLQICEAKRAEVQGEVARRRAELKALRRLREKGQREYWAAQQRLDQKRIDELAPRFTRSASL